MGIIRGLLDRGPNRPNVVVGSTWLQATTLAPGGVLEIVGESNYQKALEWAAQGRTSDGCRVSLVTAELVREPSNRHDRNAIRVDIGERTVGYLSRDMASQTHSIINHLWSNGYAATCRATLTGGWDRGWRDKGSIGCLLDIGHPPDTFRPDRYGVLPEGAHVSVTQEQHYQDVIAELLGRKSQLDLISTLAIAPDPHRKCDDPAVQVNINGSRTIGYLTPKMSQRYVPFLRAAQGAGLTLTSRTKLSRGDKKLEAHIRLPRDPEALLE